MAKRLVIGVIGRMGSGKGILSDYLVEKYKFHKISMGDLVRAETRKKGIEINRLNLQNLAKEYRKKFGENYWIDLTIKKAKENNEKYILVDGVRTFADANELKKNLEAKIIMVDASPELRYGWMKKRGRKGYAKTLEQFKKDEKNEPGYAELSKTLKLVDYTVENSGTKEEFYKKIDDLMEKLKS